MTKNTYWNEGETVSKRIDHATEAHEYEREACGAQRIGEESAEAMATLSLMKATLALVEQQRVANIIALGEHWQRTGYDFADSVAPVLRDDIQAALGLD